MPATPLWIFWIPPLELLDKSRNLQLIRECDNQPFHGLSLYYDIGLFISLRALSDKRFWKDIWQRFSLTKLKRVSWKWRSATKTRLYPIIKINSNRKNNYNKQQQHKQKKKKTANVFLVSLLLLNDNKCKFWGVRLDFEIVYWWILI